MWRLNSKNSFVLILLLLFVLLSNEVIAQSWLPGYNYRMKISVNKSLVSGNLNLFDFPLLISLEDPALSYVAGRCSGNNISSTKGLDFAFTLVSAPAAPLKYQLDHYEPASGKLISWVKVPSLSASGSSAAATEIYLYYGSNTIHFPQQAEAQATWGTEVNRVWHMNGEGPAQFNRNAKNGVSGEGLTPINLRPENYGTGKIGQAVTLNGLNQRFISVKDNNPNFFISCWLKLSAINREQVIITADSASLGGYVFKISEQNQLVLQTRINSVVTERTVSFKLAANQWYHVAALQQNTKRGFFINGTYYSTGVVVGSVKLGGQIVVGSNKQQQNFLSATIDELQIQSTEPTEDWIRTLYRNQNDPSAFYVVSTQQRNDVIVPTGTMFSGQSGDRWTEASNWNTQEVPGNLEQIIIAKNATLNMEGTEPLVLNTLNLEPDAVIKVNHNLEVLCQSNIASGARMILSAGAAVQLDGQVQNDGRITSAASGILTFSGSNALQQVSGTGTMDLYALHIDQSSKLNTVRLQQQVNINGYVRPFTGLLDANGFLTLKHNGAETAFISPIPDVSVAGIIGETTVEQLVPGSYPDPATARGWRLFSPPVYHGNESGRPYYHLYDYKQSIFVTGPGGTGNGFDTSPQNGHTIYTHNQATVGSLSQKYMGIPAMNTVVQTGKGIYVYSRGSRNIPDAFIKQIQVAPFQNPAGYIINHKGLLFQGAIEVEAQSRNMGESGDGFNLLGNPYAAALRWGDIQKEQMSAFIWKFNPLNNAYDVSDDPNTIISAGEGFFVKVLNGFEKGRAIFKESSKSTASNFTAQANVKAQQDPADSIRRVNTAFDAKAFSAVNSIRNASEKQINTSALHAKLNLVLSRDVFQQQYTVIFSSSGNDELDDQDAPAIGTGYVGISGISSGVTKLSIDSRTFPARGLAEIPFTVRGWASGNYQIRIGGMDSFPSYFKVILADKYLNVKQEIKADHTYNFEINTAVPESYGEQRFTLQVVNTSPHIIPALVDTIVEDKIRLYPNPFKAFLNLKLPENMMMKLGVRVWDLMGQLILRTDLGLVSGQQPATLDTNSLVGGIYIVEVINLENNQRLKSVKVIKQ
jgi:hypothetical protein